jgi:hypothetical protein
VAQSIRAILSVVIMAKGSRSSERRFLASFPHPPSSEPNRLGKPGQLRGGSTLEKRAERNGVRFPGRDPCPARKGHSERARSQANPAGRAQRRNVGETRSMVPMLKSKSDAGSGMAGVFCGPGASTLAWPWAATSSLTFERNSITGANGVSRCAGGPVSTRPREFSSTSLSGNSSELEVLW